MKSVLPFYGLSSAVLKATLRPILREYAPATRAEWEFTIRALMDDATHREEWYAAVALARHRRAAGWQDPDALELYRHLIVTAAWWDIVDEVAAHLVGGVLHAHRPLVAPVLLAWATDTDPWLRRTAVLAQLRHRDATDLTLLVAAIEANRDDTSFWLRKAIGWSLREYAKTDPDWVRAFVASHQLSGLSVREATKHL